MFCRFQATLYRALWLAILLIISRSAELRGEDDNISYAEWRKRCLKTPANRRLRGRLPAKEQLPLKDFGTVKELALTYLKQSQQGTMAEETRWLGEKPVASKFFDIRRSYYTRPSIPFQPFAEKRRVETGAELIFHGDFHGDLRSFIALLDWLNRTDRMDGFKIKKPKTYLVFLGDYTDRGAYGVEVIYTLLRLKLANPDHVLMARGNHEDFQLTAAYGFVHEGQAKYGVAFSPLPIWRMFDFLPVVIYLGSGSDFIQCNHGGMEPGFDPTGLLNADGKQRLQFLGALKQKTFLREHPQWLPKNDETARQLAEGKLMDFTPRSPTSPASLGFMWSDYSLFASDRALSYDANRLAFVFGSSTTRYLLDRASKGRSKLKAVFRAHQHSGIPNAMMKRLVASKGAFRHWQTGDRADIVDRAKIRAVVDTTAERSVPQGSVWTFNVSPDSVYGAGNDYSFDTIGVLRTAAAFKDWRLKVVNIAVKID